MVIKDDPRRLLDLLGTKHREKDPDDEFLDRLAKKTSFKDQPKVSQGLTLPEVRKAVAELDGMADVTVQVDVQVAPQLDPAAAAAEQKRKEEREKREARYASLFNGRSSGGNDSTGVPEHLDFKQLKGKTGEQKLPSVGTQVSAEELAAREEDQARRAAWMELNRLRDQHSPAGEQYRKAHERFVATWGHPGMERQ